MFAGSSLLQRVSVLCASLWLNGSPCVGGRARLCLSLYPLMDIWAVAPLGCREGCAVNIHARGFVWMQLFICLGGSAWSRIAGPCVTPFGFTRRSPWECRVCLSVCLEGDGPDLFILF